MSKYRVLKYTVIKCRKDGSAYGRQHASSDGETTCCGKDINDTWIIVYNNYEGHVDCLECRKKLKLGASSSAYEKVMEPDEVQAIKDIIYNAWDPPPALRAAQELRDADFTTMDLHAFGKTATGQYVHSSWLTNTFSELHTLELNDEK